MHRRRLSVLDCSSISMSMLLDQQIQRLILAGAILSCSAFLIEL
jgi:hypothetical protein